MTAVVLVIGEGLLADFTCAELSASCRVIRRNAVRDELPCRADLALVLHDAWHPADHHEAEEVFPAPGIPWLRGFVAFGEGVIGPLVRPGVPGCSQCADLRRLMAGNDRKEMWELTHRMSSFGGVKRDVWGSRSSLLQAAHLLAAESRNILEGRPSRLEGNVFLLNLTTLAGSLHSFLPDPECPICGKLVDDTPEGAVISLRPNPKLHPDSYRVRPMDELKNVLACDYFDNRTGLLNGQMADFHSPFGDVAVNLPIFSSDEVCAGRTMSYEDSRLTGILEGLERYAGMSPRAKRTVVRDSYRNLAVQALNPLRIGVHSEEDYGSPGFPFQRFHPDCTVNWVWGYSLLQEQPILVPELLAYYGTGGEEGFVYETSNGCALGGSLEEAIFHGILEVVERDSFLLTWYARLPLPRIDPYSSGDKELGLMIDRMKAVTGYELYLFNATMENGIPSVWALAKNLKPKGANVLCAGGAHPDPIKAVKSAVHEIAGMVVPLDAKFEANRDEYVRMLHDPFEVKRMEDHSMLYGLAEAEERFTFLLKDRSGTDLTFAEAFGSKAKHDDLTDDLKSLLAAFRRLKLDVIVVNQTTPEMTRNDLHCVKVIIPGMLPMTFGYRMTRLEGLDRVLRVPSELGFASRPLTPSELNTHPHPFP